jgi:predicted TIM-barrel fold metal-dependent hydrolase
VGKLLLSASFFEDLSDEAKEKILYRNAKKFYGLSS